MEIYANNCVGEQNSNYLLKNTKVKAIFALLHSVRSTLYPPQNGWFSKDKFRKKLVMYLMTRLGIEPYSPVLMTSTISR